MRSTLVCDFVKLFMVRQFKEFDYPTMYRRCSIYIYIYIYENRGWYIGVAIPIKMIEKELKSLRDVPINLVNTKNFHIIDLIFC